MIISNIIQLIDDFIDVLQDRRKRAMVVALGIGNITACNVVGPFNNSPSTDPQLTSLVITDTNYLIESPAILDPTKNNGAFTITWTQSGSSAYTTTAYLSLDALPDDVSSTLPAIRDIALFHIDVTDPNASFGSDKNPASTKPCIYATDNTIDCGGTKVDIQAMLTTLPASLNIVLESCLASDTKKCAYAAYPVTLK